MNWFRSNKKAGSRLALFALAIQFALSSGHFHEAAAHNIQGGLTDAAPAYAAPDAISETAAQHQPSNHDSDRHPADGCVICTVISLASNALLISSPSLEPPQAIEILRYAANAEFAHLGSHHPAFQSRAPPLS